MAKTSNAAVFAKFNCSSSLKTHATGSFIDTTIFLHAWGYYLAIFFMHDKTNVVISPLLFLFWTLQAPQQHVVFWLHNVLVHGTSFNKHFDVITSFIYSCKDYKLRFYLAKKLLCTLSFPGWVKACQENVPDSTQNELVVFLTCKPFRLVASCSSLSARYSWNDVLFRALQPSSNLSQGWWGRCTPNPIAARSLPTPKALSVRFFGSKTER